MDGGTKMDRKFEEIMLENSDVIIKMWMKEIEELKNEKYTSSISDELFEVTNREFVNVIFTSLNNQGSVANIEKFAEKLINLGWPISYLTDGLQSFRHVAIHFILNKGEQIDTDYFASLIDMIDSWIDPIIHQLVNKYSGSWEHIVSLQRVALQELSAPLIPVMDNITVMPLIGTIDTERAKLIMENLLDGVIAHRAEVVLMDITGVPIVDTMVAHHIIQAAEAVRLIGSECILVGIRPEIAQTIVNLGIDLSAFPTQSSLRKGFNAALKMTNRKIVDLNVAEEKTIDEMIKSIPEE